jgi:hypothetical protein
MHASLLGRRLSFIIFQDGVRERASSFVVSLRLTLRRLLEGDRAANIEHQVWRRYNRVGFRCGTASLNAEPPLGELVR